MIIIQTVSIIFAIISIYGIRINKKIFNPLTVFCGIWAVILFLSSLCLFDLKDTSYYVYSLLCIGISAFAFGYLLNYKFLKSAKIVLRKRKNQKNINFVPRYYLIYVLLIFTIFFEFLNAKDSIKILISGQSLDSVLLSVRSSSGEARGTIKNVINNLIIGPFKFAIFPICAYNIANKGKNMLTILTLLLMFICVVASGGRIFIIFLIVALCVSFSFSFFGKARLKEKMVSIKNNKKRFRFIMFTFMALFVAVSFSRSGQKLIMHMYLYFSMQPTMFETWSKIIDEKGLIGFGEASLNGFTFHILYLIKNIFRLQYPSHWYEIFNAVMDVDTNWKAITNAGLPANAYVSAFWYFYVDAREIGIVLFSFFYGLISASVFKKTVKNPNIKNVCIYSIFLFSVVDTYVRIRFTTGDYVGGFLLLTFVLFKRVKKKDVSELYVEGINNSGSI